MKTLQLYLISILAILLSSCYSYKIYPKEYRNIEAAYPQVSAFVLNPNLIKELEILESSTIFNIVDDSTRADIHINLHPMEKSFVCGQPLTLSMLSLGQVPVMLPDRYLFRFDEIDKGVVTERKFELQIAQRVWFWDVFAFNKKFEEKAGQAVMGVYLNLNQ